MTGLRNVILTRHDWASGAGPMPGASPTSVPLGGKGGRLASIGAPMPRHRRLRWSHGSRVLGRVDVVRVSGTESSWTRTPQPGDMLVGRGGELYGTWLKLKVLGTQWWDFGKTLEILVEVVGEAACELGGLTKAAPAATTARPRKARPLAGSVAAAAMLTIGGAAMADGTYATLDTQAMGEYLKRLEDWPREVRQGALVEAAEAVLSEAQVRSPVLTGFLQNSHVVLDNTTDQEDGAIVIGVNTVYALPVHETHPTKKRWFIGALIEHFPRVFERLLRRSAQEKGAS